VGLIALVAAGCASARPLASTKVAQAERAIDEAQQSGAVTTAPTELRTAEDKLKDAQAAMAKGDYDTAIRLADQAAADADYARAGHQRARHQGGRRDEAEHPGAAPRARAASSVAPVDFGGRRT